jgi:hypothetical protein
VIVYGRRSGVFFPHGLLGGFLGLSDSHGGVGFTAHRSARSALNAQPKLFGHVVVNGTRVGFLLGNAELGQHVDDGVRRDLKLPCELIDSNFTHK